MCCSCPTVILSESMINMLLALVSVVALKSLGPLPSRSCKVVGNDGAINTWQYWAWWATVVTAYQIPRSDNEVAQHGGGSKSNSVFSAAVGAVLLSASIFMPCITHENTHPCLDEFKTRFPPKHGGHTQRNNGGFGNGNVSSRRLQRCIARRMQYAFPAVEKPSFEKRWRGGVILFGVRHMVLNYNFVNDVRCSGCSDTLGTRHVFIIR